MPIYEYECNKCGLVFEARQKFSDLPLQQCKECGGEVRKLISSTGFALKGGGWYEQGYSSDVPSSCGKAKAGTCTKAVG